MRESLSIRNLLASAAYVGLVVVGGCAPAEHARIQQQPVGSEPVAAGSTSQAPPVKAAPDAENPKHSSSKTDNLPVTPENRSAVIEPPTLGELPNLKPNTRRSISPRVEAEGSHKKSKRRLVPEYGEIALSDEEKKALGKDKPEPADDVMSFYVPGPNPDKGVSILESDLKIGIVGRGGAAVGQNAPPTRAYAYGTGGKHSDPTGVPREGASSYNERDLRWQVSFPWILQVGEGRVRKGAEQIPFEEQ